MDTLTISHFTARHARYRPAEPAVTVGSQRFDWSDYHRRVTHLADTLRVAGVTPGDRVATVLGNCLTLLDVYWACANLGAVSVPFSPLLQVAGLKSLLTDAMPRVVFASAATKAAVIEAMREALPTAKLIVVNPPEEGVPIGQGEQPSADTCAAESVRALVSPDDPCNIMYTSGTTGVPKGILLTHRIRAHYAALMANAFRITPNSVVLHTGAIVFNGAFVTMMPVFMQGGHYILHTQFDPRQFIETVASERVTHTMLVPAQIIAILDYPDLNPADLESLQVLLSLGAPLPLRRKEQLDQLLPGRFHELYGLTEGFVTILDRDDTLRKRGSVGIPPPFFDLRIVREDGSDAGPGEVGEIAGRGPILMSGYYRRPDLTATAVRDGWLFTGDLGYVDGDGYLYLVDRKKDMIDSGGVKVYPRDIEEVLASHPDVSEGVVFGVPDEKWGETPIAVVQLRLRADGPTVSADELKDWINAHVAARYQRVSAVKIVAELPRNAAGKVLKHELRAPYWSGHGASI